MSDYFSYLTDAGKAAFASSLATGIKVPITVFKVGDGNGSSYTPTGEEAALRRVVWTGAVNRVYLDPINSQWFIVEAYIPSDVGDFTIREGGIFNDLGEMLGICKLPETYKPTVASGTVKDIYIRMKFEVANASDVELVVDPSAIIASQQWVTELLNDELTPVAVVVHSNTMDIGLVREEVAAADAVLQGNIDDLETAMDEADEAAETLATTRIQQGEVTIYSRGVRNGLAVTPTGSNRELQIGAGKFYLNGRLFGIGALVTDNPVPENTSGDTVTNYLVVDEYLDGAVYRIRARVLTEEDENGLTLREIQVPNNSTFETDDDLSGITLINNTTTETNWPQILTDPQFETVTFDTEMASTDYHIELDVVESEGNDPELIIDSRATNSFRIYLGGRCDAVKVRWKATLMDQAA